MNRSDVKVVNLQPPDSITAIVNHDIEAMVAWQPHAFNALRRLGDNAIVFPNEGIYTGVFCMATLRGYAEAHPEVVEKFLRGLIDAESFVQQHPDEAIRIVAKQVGIEPEHLGEFYGEYKFVVKLSDVLLDVLQKEGEWARLSGIVPQEDTVPDYRSYILTEPLKNISPERVTVTLR